MLKEAFPIGKFGAAATEEQINAVETALKVRFPAQLRALYNECDGFREDVGNAKYLLSLTDEDFVGSLRSITEFCWTEVKQTWPMLDLTPFIFFGSSAGDELWGIRWPEGNEIIAFHHSMEGTFEVVGSDILAVYESDYLRYSEDP